jgi:SSS family solute:Na+ symporter
MTDTNTFAIIWIIGFVIIVITLIGGIEAVIWADVVQGFLLIAGGIASFIILIVLSKAAFPSLAYCQRQS